VARRSSSSFPSTCFIAVSPASAHGFVVASEGRASVYRWARLPLRAAVFPTASRVASGRTGGRCVPACRCRLLSNTEGGVGFKRPRRSRRKVRTHLALAVSAERKGLGWGAYRSSRWPSRTSGRTTAFGASNIRGDYCSCRTRTSKLGRQVVEQLPWRIALVVLLPSCAVRQV
jgi:hypothetical protein